MRRDYGPADRARAGDQEAFRHLVEPYRHRLQLHCYRILGSVDDAEDALQETLLSARQGLGGLGRDLGERFLTATAVLHPRCKLVATRANGQPAFGVYARDPWAPIQHAAGLLVLTLAGDRICAMTRFETSMLAHFGLPRTLPH